MQKEKELADCVGCLFQAMRMPYPEKPTPSDWLKGPWESQIIALEHVMLDQADESIRGIAYPILKVHPSKNR